MTRSSLEQLDTLLTVKDVAKILSLHPRTVRKMVAAGKLPTPFHLSRKVTRWKASDIQSYLDGLPPVP